MIKIVTIQNLIDSSIIDKDTNIKILFDVFVPTNKIGLLTGSLWSLQSDETTNNQLKKLLKLDITSISMNFIDNSCSIRILHRS